MATLTITRGLPGAGKSMLARAWVAENPAGRARVSRDDLRAQLHGSNRDWRRTEDQVIAARDSLVRTLLLRRIDVVVDDTNLPSSTVRDLRQLAASSGAEFTVLDLTDVPLEVCLARNAERPRPTHVPERRLRDLHTRYVAGRPHPLPLTDEDDDPPARVVPYVPPADAPRAVMVDIDGTVALITDRSPYDESRVDQDHPNEAVITVVAAMYGAGHRLIFCSGRTERSRAATEAWLREHVDLPYDALHLRAVGDARRDSVVKLEIFDREIRNQYHVVAVFDDRAQVVSAWRSIGLTVFAVAEGQF